MILVRIVVGIMGVALIGGAFIFMSVPIIVHMFDVSVAYWGG